MKNLLVIVGCLLLTLIMVSPLLAAGIVVDETSANCKLIGNWADIKGNNVEGKNFSSGGCVGGMFHYTSSHGKWKRTGREKAIWTPKLPSAGNYKVEVSWRGTGNRSSKVTYEVTHAKGKTRKTVSQRTDGMTWKSLGVYEFAAGSAGNVALVGDGGSSACADAARFTKSGAEANSGDSGSTMDDVIFGGTDSGNDAGASSGGGKSVKIEKAGTVKVKALLSTYGQAMLKVVKKGKDGKTQVVMNWERSDDKDSSPLHVNGKAVKASMYENNPGDWSPKEQIIPIECQAGDELQLILEGDFGGATSILEIVGGAGATSSNGEAVSGGNDGGSTSDNSQEVSAGGSQKISLPFNKNWEMNCQFTPKSTSGFARMIAGSGSAHGRKIDLFTASGKGLRFRLANKQIFFLAASVGKVSNPGETSDHWLDTTVGSIQKGKTYNLTIVYNFTGKSVQLKMDGKIIADATFKVQKMPSPLGKITFPEASGKVKVTLK